MHSRKHSAGVAAIELALVLPLLLLLSYPVYDFFRAIQASMILTNISREGANLASRTSNPDYQDIMNKLAATTPPLEMIDDGMIYVTLIKGEIRDGSLKNVVQEQYRWRNGPTGNYSPPVSIWDCTQWNTDGSCNMPTPLPVTNNMSLTLDNGESVYAVDVFYRLPSLFGFGSSLMSIRIFPEEFHSMTIL